MLPGSPAGFQYDQLPTGEDVARVRPCGSGCRGGVLSQRSIRLPPWFPLKAENMHPREVFHFNIRIFRRLQNQLIYHQLLGLLGVMAFEVKDVLELLTLCAPFTQKRVILENVEITGRRNKVLSSEQSHGFCLGLCLDC